MKEANQQHRRELINDITLVPPVAMVTAFVSKLAPRLFMYMDFFRVIIFAKSMNRMFTVHGLQYCKG